MTEEWRELALCAQVDGELWFPEKGGSTREAKRICNRCEVKAECLEYALGHDERFGIWGGLSERERRRLKRKVKQPRNVPAVVARIEALAAAGLGDPEIGAELNISRGSVYGHRRRHGIPAGRPPGSSDSALADAVRAKVPGVPWRESERQLQPVGGGVR